MKTILISVLLCFAFFSAKHSSAQNINPDQIRFPAGCTSGTVYSPFGNQCVNQEGGSSVGGVVYPAVCQAGGAPSWCGASGQTADVYIREACSQLPAAGGVVNLRGLTGNIAATVTCSTPTKQVITIEDPTSLLTITEADGGTVFPQDVYSMFLGPGVGQCMFGRGIVIAASANIAALVAQAHNDGTQEAFAANGLCVTGTNGMTIGKGLFWADRVFTNTAFNENYVNICNTACVLVQDVGGSMTINGNVFNALDGITTFNVSPVIIQAVNGGNGSIEIASNTIQGGSGTGSPAEIKIVGSGPPNDYVSEGIWIHDNYLEREVAGDTYGIYMSDCQGCSIENVQGGGTQSGTDFIHITESYSGGTQSLHVQGILATAWNNILTDTLTGVSYPGSSTNYLLKNYDSVAGNSSDPCAPLPYVPNPLYTRECWMDTNTSRLNVSTSNGVQQYAYVSDVATSLKSTGADETGGLGNFETGSGTMGTGFGASGCKPSAGTTCTYTRTNATAAVGTYSQEIQITANTDQGGLDGVEYQTPISFTAGQSFAVSFWAKSDGTIPATGYFELGDTTVPVTFCSATLPAFTTTWTLYTTVCTPTASGSSYLIVGANVASGTGTFCLDDLIVAPVQPLTQGEMIVPNGPYSVQSSSTSLPITSVLPGLMYSAAGTPIPTCNTASKGLDVTVSDNSVTTFYGTYTSGGSNVTKAICDGTTWRTH
jgi:hypothetical protein